MQDEKKLRGEIRNYIFEYFLFGYEEDELKDDMSFLDLGVLDSTGIMELVAYIQRQYKIKVKDEEIIPDNLDSVNAITSFIIKKEEEACS
jgi:acyl carrier protein